MSEASLDSEPLAQALHFPCAQCAAALEYAPGTKVLRCTHCGYENQISKINQAIIEQNFQLTLRNLAHTATSAERIAIHCKSCGATYSFDADTHAGECPFCGTPAVADTTQYRALLPQALLPFKIGRDQARASFRQWLGSLWFAPGKLKAYARNDAHLHGIYVPYWTYDADTATQYRGERGDNYQAQESYQVLENGRQVTKTRMVTKIRWYPVSGRVQRFFNDVLVLASKSLPRNITEQLEPWDLTNLTPYQEEYLSGFRSEMYQVDLEQGFAYAREIIAGRIQQDIRRDIGGDHQRIHSADTRYSEIHFKHILLPIWLSAFRFRGKTYRFVVNGRTGEVQGERPYSGWKIAFTIALVATLVGGGFMLWQHYH